MQSTALTPLFFALLSASAAADTLRFASGYPSTAFVDERPYISSNIIKNFGTTWNVVGMTVEFTQRTRIDLIAGVGGYVGDDTPSSAVPFLNVFSSEEIFRTSNVWGDVYSGQMDFFREEAFSLESESFTDNYYVEFETREPVVLGVGTYVVSSGLELFGDNWAWVYSTEDLGTDLLVSSTSNALFYLDDESDTGTVAVDIFGTPIPDGDYDFDGDVDADDYQVWKASYGSTSDLAADGNADGDVDVADYTVWRDNAPPEAFASTLVPEPAGLAVLLSVLAVRATLNPRRIR